MSRGLVIGGGLLLGGGVLYLAVRERGALGAAAEAAYATTVIPMYEAQKAAAKQAVATAKKGFSMAVDYSALGLAIKAAKKAWGVVPSDELLQLAARAVAPFGVPLDVFVAFMRNESGLKTKGMFRQEKNSYSKWRNIKAPGSDKTWGQLYTEAEWGSYGPMQLMPFNFVGTTGGIAPGEPLGKGHDTLFNFFQAARLIRDLYRQKGNWRDTFRAYNGAGTTTWFYALHVATYLKAIGVGGIIGDADVAKLRGFIVAERGSKAPSPAGTPYAKLQRWERWQTDLDKFLGLPASTMAAAAVAPPTTAEVGAAQAEPPRDEVESLLAAIDEAYLLRNLDRAVELEQELEQLTAGAENGTGLA